MNLFPRQVKSLCSACDSVGWVYVTSYDTVRKRQHVDRLTCVACNGSSGIEPPMHALIRQRDELFAEGATQGILLCRWLAVADDDLTMSSIIQETREALGLTGIIPEGAW